MFETNVLTTQDNDMYEDPRENLDDSYEPPPSHRVFTTAPSASFSRGEYLGRCIITFFCCLFIDGFVFLYDSSTLTVSVSSLPADISLDHLSAVGNINEPFSSYADGSKKMMLYANTDVLLLLLLLRSR